MRQGLLSSFVESHTPAEDSDLVSGERHAAVSLVPGLRRVWWQQLSNHPVCYYASGMLGFSLRKNAKFCLKSFKVSDSDSALDRSLRFGQSIARFRVEGGHS